MPSTATDVIDSVSTSAAVKAPVRGIVTANVALSGLSAITTLTGTITPVNGDRFLLTAQTDAAENLIYEARSGAWTLAPDSDGARDLRHGSLVVTQGGLAYGLDTADPIEPGATELAWSTRFSAMLSAFGASPSSPDNTAAINAALAFIRDNQDATIFASGASLIFDVPGVYTCLGSINATGIRDVRSWTIEANGAVILSKAAGKVAWDMCNSRYATFASPLHIIGDATDSPSVGFQIGRVDTTIAAGGHCLNDLTVTGTFTRAAGYNLAAEVVTGENTKFWNNDDAAGSYALIQDNDNTWGMQSDFETVTITPGTPQSFTRNVFINLDARKPNGGPTIWLKRTSGHRYHGYAVSVDDSTIVVESDSFGHHDLELDVHCEAEGLQHCVKFTSADAVATTIRGFKFRDAAVNAELSIFKRDASTPSVILRHADISVSDFQEPIATIFSDANFTVEGPTLTGYLRNHADIQALTMARIYTRIFLDGGVSQTNGVPAEWYWDMADTTSADDGNEVLVDAASRRWKRLVHNGFRSVLGFSGTTRTLSMADTKRFLRATGASAVTITAPNDTNAAQIMPGDLFSGSQNGAGVITFVADSGVTINSRTGLISPGQYARWDLRKTAANTYLLTWADAGEVSVLWYGAKVDGATDDVAAVNSAITAVNAAGGGVVRIPAGTMLVGVSTGSLGIVMKSNVRLIGAGREATTIKLKNGADAHTITALNLTDFAIENLTVDGNRTNQTVNAHGIRLEGCSHYRIENVRVESTRGYGIGAQAGTLKYGLHRNVYVYDSGNDGIDYKNVNDNNENLTFDNITVEGFDLLAATGKAGIDVRGPANLSNIVILGMAATNSVGIRLRQTDAGGNGIGGKQSNLTNFRVMGSDAVGTHGVYAADPNVKISNGWVQDVATGVTILAASTAVSNVQVYSSTTGFNATNDGSTLYGHYATISNSEANTCTTGFKVDAVNGVKLIDNNVLTNTTGVNVVAASNDALVSGNYFSGNTTNVTDSGTATRARNNAGYKTEASGTGTILSGTTSLTITHGLSVTPTLDDISIIFGEQGTNDYGRFWISSITSTQFTVNVSADPGASNLDFAWRAVSL